MIEKLTTYPRPLPNNPMVVEDVGMDNKSLFDKINELVDAVNELQKDREEIKEWIAIVADLRSRVPVVESRISILEEHVHPTATTEPADPYAEQRKWVGKLCRVETGGEYRYGILKDVSASHPTHPFNVDGLFFRVCEPVKLDDDVIYKGGDNE